MGPQKESSAQNIRSMTHLRLRSSAKGPTEHPRVQITDSLSAAQAIQLVLWHDLQGNHYVETGYRSVSRDPYSRPVAASIQHCLHSLTYLHNETVNIFSHTFGAIVFLALPAYVFNVEIPPRYAIATPADMVVCSVYFIGVGICFLFSAIFHTLVCHSPDIFSFGLKLDFQGVILLMWGANIPLIYYGFICDPGLQLVYWSLTSFLALCCSIFTFQPHFSDPHLRPLRTATFGSLALSTFIPVVHGLVKYDFALQYQRIALPWILLTLLFNVLGASAYAFKFPEKWYPRRFDMFGASHQIMHIMILIAGFMYAFGVLAEFDYRHSNIGRCLA
ncbi:hemolysin-III related-domain-containing protein [Lasiosphaeris hirsuta]|uniref:Hemolysin-III related-domain-containing protein n=1 Tax=Lasiosphaeris hirsuta TaxID=260670 RepID=A0AA40B028_9PEZI|nr:hemolysin-III related-domain-containing protein [Lasiosphaeris hirsuta]